MNDVAWRDGSCEYRIDRLQNNQLGRKKRVEWYRTTRGGFLACQPRSCRYQMTGKVSVF